MPEIGEAIETNYVKVSASDSGMEKDSMKTSHKHLTVVVSALVALGVITPQPVRGFSFEDFSSPAPSLITTNGDAEFTDSVLRLTPDEDGRVGSAFFNAPFDFDSNAPFSSHFQFRIHGVLYRTHL